MRHYTSRASRGAVYLGDIIADSRATSPGIRKRAKNRTKSKVRARVEHSIGVIKPVFGFAKVRYRGPKKNTHHLLVTCALANMFMARRLLLRCQPA